MSVLESLLVPQNDTGVSIMASYAMTGMKEPESMTKSELTDIMEKYRSDFRKGFDDEHLLGDDIHDYMYSADTSDAIKNVLAIYSPYTSGIIEEYPESVITETVLDDMRTMAGHISSQSDVTYVRLIQDIESCSVLAMRIVLRETEAQRESGNEDFNQVVMIEAALKILLESDEYPELNALSKTVRQTYILPALVLRTGFLLMYDEEAESESESESESEMN